MHYMLSYSMFTMRNLYYNYVQADAEDSDIEIMNDEDSDADYSDQDLQVCMILEQLNRFKIKHTTGGNGARYMLGNVL